MPCIKLVIKRLATLSITQRLLEYTQIHAATTTGANS